MTSGNKCKVKDDLVNQVIALNSKLNTLSPAFLHGEQARAEVQERRETLYIEIKKDTKANLVLRPSTYRESRQSESDGFPHHFTLRISV
jgi:hypothetical protein